MTSIRNVIVAFGLGATVAAGTASAQSPEHQDHHAQATVGQEVTLSACVQKGLKDDTFLLTNVADVPVHPATMGRVVYWLDTVKDIKPHVGRQVRITGRITAVEQSEMEVKAGEDDQGGWYVEIEGPGRDVRTPAANVGVSGAGRKAGADDIKTTLVKLKVGTVTRVAEACGQQGR